jgi:hypothetical protein
VNGGDNDDDDDDDSVNREISTYDVVKSGLQRLSSEDPYAHFPASKYEDYMSTLDLPLREIETFLSADREDTVFGRNLNHVFGPNLKFSRKTICLGAGGTKAREIGPIVEAINDSIATPQVFYLRFKSSSRTNYFYYTGKC